MLCYQLVGDKIAVRTLACQQFTDRTIVSGERFGMDRLKIAAIGLLCALSCVQVGLQAQEVSPVPQFQVTSGYTFERMDISSPVVGNLLALDGIHVPSHVNSHGWQASIEENVNHWFGGVAEFSTYYARPEIGLEDTTTGNIINIQPVNVTVNSIMFGPKVSLHRFRRLTPFGQFTLGVVHVRMKTTSLTNFLAGSAANQTSGDTVFGWGTDGGIDFSINRSVAIRVQGGFQQTQFDDMDDDRQNHFRVSTGVVFKFGQR
jgi:opacity protein-like surface antigen